ncbi:MAG: ATP-dependent helicase [Candidatus Peribacteraceae bacterium]|nr:ATP-dependent helicase [Candidatus Peribacteraceae bacterium]
MDFIKNFRAEFEKLNPNQKQAVDAVEGPLLIVAGPGTGKTQTLALRLANILHKTQARPHNLLALTFTEAAAIELKKRLAQIIGPDAYSIEATTFHSFCARLHATFPAEFATTRERLPLDELGQLQLFREILNPKNFELLAPLRAPDLYLKDIGRALSDLKREGYAPEKFREILAKEKSELENAERINPRTGKPFIKIRDAETRLAKNFELADFYEKYQTLLDERGLADYDDLILSVVEKLNSKENEFLLGYLQENFLYATVDEFQDTNGAQNAILQAWASFDEKPNLCVVGDDDQSIFRFQGASLKNITDFQKKYPATAVIPLTQNYRSTQKILDTATSLIEKNSERLVHEIPKLEKNLTAALEFKKTIAPQVVAAGSGADEVAFVVDAVQKLIFEKTPPEEIAVIYRNRAHGDALSDALVRKKIPVFRADGRNALANPRVQQMINLLKIVAEPNDALSSLAVFFADFSGIAEVEVYKISKAADFKNNFLDVALESENSKTKEFAQKLLNFQKRQASENLLELTENIAAESGLTAKVAELEEYEAAEALHTFLEFVRNFAVSREEPTLENLLADLAAMQKNYIRLAIPNRPHAAVTLTTAHSAKGLEWEQVFVIHADDASWGGRAKPQKLKLPDILGIGEPDKEKKIEEERRLFFVALTRAKQAFTISYAENYESRQVVASRFIAEIDSSLLEFTRAPEAGTATLPLAGEQKFSLDTQKFLTSLLENFRLSPTALNNFLDCPRKFLFQNLLRLPTKVSVDDRLGQIFGTAVHAAFEAFFREYKTTQKLPQIETAFTALQKSLAREPLTQQQFAAVERDAKSALEKYFASHAGLRPPVEVEFNFAKHEVRFDDVPLTGKIDRIDAIPQTTPSGLRPTSETANEVCFIDYKSVPPMTPAAICGETANSTGNSYRQLLFYSLLAELDSRFVFKPREMVLSFVRPDKNGEFRDESFTPQKAEIEELKKTTKGAWGKIQKLEFDCDESSDCRRCDFREICGK